MDRAGARGVAEPGRRARRRGRSGATPRGLGTGRHRSARAVWAVPLLGRRARVARRLARLIAAHPVDAVCGRTLTALGAWSARCEHVEDFGGLRAVVVRVATRDKNIARRKHDLRLQIAWKVQVSRAEPRPGDG